MARFPAKFSDVVITPFVELVSQGIDVHDAANQVVGQIVVGDFEDIHQRFAGINGAIGVQVEPFFDGNFFAIHEAGDVQRDDSGVGVASRGRADGQCLLR